MSGANGASPQGPSPGPSQGIGRISSGLPRPVSAQIASIQAGVGLQALRAVIRDAARTDFRRLSEDLFIEDERAHFRFVRQYYHHHGTLPPLEVLTEQNLSLPPAPAAVAHYMDRIFDRAQFNIFLAQQPAIVRAIQNRDMTEAVRLNTIMQRSLTRYDSQQDTFTLVDSVETVVAEFERALLNPGIQGITLGWSYLDDLTGGAEPGDVITLVARPGMGKSWLLVWVAQAAWLAGASVLFVTNEMTHTQMARRFLGLHGGVNPDFIRRGQVSVWGRDVVYQTATALGHGAPFHFLSGAFTKSVTAMDAAIAELAPDLVICDASYLMEPVDKNNRMASHELASAVARDIKTVAYRRNRPVVQSVQFNRSAKKEKDGSRDGTNIAGTDTILQVSTAVITVSPGEGSDENNQRKLFLPKNREGRADTGSMLINFLFEPPDFSHIPTDENGRAAVAEPEYDPGELGDPV